MKSSKDSLYALILRSGNEVPQSARAAGLAEEDPEPSGADPRFSEWSQELERHIPAGAPQELDRYYHCAVMGLTLGFLERRLSPHLEAHTDIIGPLLDDIRTVYERILASDAAYSEEEFTYRAYDYGLNKAYHLDWSLYLSHEMY